MEKAAERRLIFAKFFEWYLKDQPRAILKGWLNILKFNWNYFSIPLLLRTLFSPWRKYRWSYGRGFDLKVYFEAFTSNVISRSLGAFLRLVLITVGIFIEILLFLTGLMIFISWFFWPLIVFVFLVIGLSIIS